MGPQPARSTPGVERPEVEIRTLRRLRRRIVPLIVGMYFLAYLDRNNVGFAGPSMSEDLGFTQAVFGLGAGIFFVGYVLFEVPSNAAMYRFGARRWIARIMISWGVMATLMAVVWNETTFYVFRFLLGAAEAGFFPAVIFYFTLWFPARHRVAVLGLFVAAQPVANAIGAPLSGLLLELDGVLGLHGWQWLFLAEGIPTILIGLFVPLLVTDHPAQATWLQADERAWLVDAMAAEAAAKTPEGPGNAFRTGLKDGRAWVYGVLNFGMVCGIYGLGLWLPTIIKSLGGYDNTTLGLLVMIPYAVAVPFVLLWARRADRTGRRAWHTAVSLGLAACGLIGAAYLLPLNPFAALAMLSVAAIGIFSAIGPMLSMPSALFAGAAAAASIGLVNALGNVGGFVAPYIVGLIKQFTGSDQLALTFLAACLAVTGVAVLLFARRRPEGDARIENARIAGTGPRRSTTDPEIQEGPR